MTQSQPDPRERPTPEAVIAERLSNLRLPPRALARIVLDALEAHGYRVLYSTPGPPLRKRPGGNLPTFAPSHVGAGNVVELSDGHEGGWCGDVHEHDAHGTCEGT